MFIYLQMIETEEDKSKFEQLYLTYRGLMYHVAMNILQNPHDAEDAVHQSFLSILNHLDKIKNVVCPQTRSFLVITTERKAIDIIRSKSKIIDIAFDETIHGVEVPPPGDHGLADAMAKLPARYREVLLLRYDNGFTTKEISKILNLKRASVQKLLWRAKNALQELLVQEGVESL